MSSHASANRSLIIFNALELVRFFDGPIRRSKRRWMRDQEKKGSVKMSTRSSARDPREGKLEGEIQEKVNEKIGERSTRGWSREDEKGTCSRTLMRR